MGDPFKQGNKGTIARIAEQNRQTRADTGFWGGGGYGRGSGQLWAGGSFANPATGLGTFDRDKVMRGRFHDPVRISDIELAAAYHGSALVKRAMEIRPMTALARGYNITLPGDKADERDVATNIELANDAEKYAAKLRFNEMFLDACIFGRLFGGGLLMVGLDDGKDPSLPLDEDNIRAIRYVNFVDRRFLYALTYYGDPFAQHFGEPETYRVTSMFGDNRTTVVHASRCIRFDGGGVEILKKRELAGWTYSTLQAAYDSLRIWMNAIQASGNLLVDASQGVFKLKGLMDAIGTPGAEELIMQRMAMIDYRRSSGQSLQLDAEEEDFDRKATPFQGIPEMLDRMMQMVAADFETPVTLLFKRSPAGLNATGDSDFRDWYDSIDIERKIVHSPKIQKFFSWVFAAQDGPTGGELPEHILVNWAPLWQPTAKERAETEYIVAQRDAIYITNSVWEAPEVAISRADGKLFCDETEIDIDERRRALEATFNISAMQDEQILKNPEQLPQRPPQEPANPQIAPVGPLSQGDPKYDVT